MNFIKVSCLIAQAQCLTNWGDILSHIVFLQLPASRKRLMDIKEKRKKKKKKKRKKKK